MEEKRKTKQNNGVLGHPWSVMAPNQTFDGSHPLSLCLLKNTRNLKKKKIAFV